MESCVYALRGCDVRYRAADLIELAKKNNLEQIIDEKN